MSAAAERPTRLGRAGNAAAPACGRCAGIGGLVHRGKGREKGEGEATQHTGALTSWMFSRRVFATATVYPFSRSSVTIFWPIQPVMPPNTRIEGAMI